MKVPLVFSPALLFFSSSGVTRAKKSGGFIIPTGGGGGGGSCSTVSDYVGRGLAKYTLLDVEPLSYGCRKDSGKPGELYCEANLLDDAQDTEPDTFEFPCTRCDFDYGESLNTCVAAPCNIFTCMPTDKNTTSASNSVNGTVTDAVADFRTATTESVDYCLERRQSIYFTVQTTKDHCILSTQMIKVGHVYKSGVKNVKKTDLLFKKELTSAQLSESLEACEFLINDEKCKSCQICEDYEIGSFAADCTNVADEAVVTCDMPDGFGQIEVHTLILEDGYVAPEEEKDIIMGAGGMHLVGGSIVAAVVVVSTLLLF